MRGCTAILILLFFAVSACSVRQVSYQRDIEPVLQNKCNGCHTAPDGYGYRTTGLRMDSYDNLIKGSVYGPVILPGDSRRSTLNKLIEGRAGMLKQHLNINTENALTHDEEAAFRNWVDQGALDN